MDPSAFSSDSAEAAAARRMGEAVAKQRRRRIDCARGIVELERDLESILAVKDRKQKEEKNVARMKRNQAPVNWRQLNCPKSASSSSSSPAAAEGRPAGRVPKSLDKHPGNCAARP